MNGFDEVIIFCQDLLDNFPLAKDVKNYANGRLREASQKKFSFGFFPGDENLSEILSFIGEAKLSKLDLIYDKVIQDGVSSRRIKRSTLNNHNLIMPYKDVYGNIVAIVGRTPLSEEDRAVLNIPKYKNTSFNKGNHLFGLFEAKSSIIKNNLVYIVEGQFDCISAHDKGLENIVALGSSSMTFEQLALILRYTNNIVLLLDNDKAGNAGADKAVKAYAKYANIKKTSLPAGIKDIDEFLSSNSVEDFNFILR